MKKSEQYRGAGETSPSPFRRRSPRVTPITRIATLLIALLVKMACGPDAPPVLSNETASSTDSGSDQTANRPDRIILISMDTVRADRVSGYGPASNTPHLAEIASEGVLFRNFYAASSYTLPSTMSMFTGLDPLEHGLWSEAALLSPDVRTLAEVLREAGCGSTPPFPRPT